MVSTCRTASSSVWTSPLMKLVLLVVAVVMMSSASTNLFRYSTAVSAYVPKSTTTKRSLSTILSPFAVPNNNNNNQRILQHHRNNNLLCYVRGGGGSMPSSSGFGINTKPQLYQRQNHILSAESKSASSIREVPDNNQHETILKVAIDSLCKINHEQQQSSSSASTLLNRRNFGGIEYTNTAADSTGSNASPYRVLFVLGGPGAGKGTQSELMVQQYPVEHYSVGQLLRDEIQRDNSPHRSIIENTLKNGGIVPVEISLSLLYDAMQRSQQQATLVLVDGFPRNYDNLYGWCVNMKDVTQLQGVLVYQCPFHVLEKRILQRSIESPGRSDDNIVALQKRFVTFEQQTVPVIDILREAAAATTATSTSVSSHAPPYDVVDIAADQSIDDVWQVTQYVLNKYITDDVLTANDALLRAIEANDAAAYQELCDPTWFHNPNDGSVMDPTIILQQNEQFFADDNDRGTSSNIQIKNATVEVINGKHVIVRYDRSLNNIPMNEQRVWSHHGPAGWQLIHFTRTPVTDTGSNCIETTTTPTPTVTVTSSSSSPSSSSTSSTLI